MTGNRTQESTHLVEQGRKVINVKNIKRRGWESEAAGDSDAIFPAITCEHDTV
jgi:hypothetical protein